MCGRHIAYKVGRGRGRGGAKLKGRAILTINDHPDMRRLFDRFPGKSVGITYTVGGGKGAARKERIYVAKGRGG